MCVCLGLLDNPLSALNATHTVPLATQCFYTRRSMWHFILSGFSRFSIKAAETLTRLHPEGRHATHHRRDSRELSATGVLPGMPSRPQP